MLEHNKIIVIIIIIIIITTPANFFHGTSSICNTVQYFDGLCNFKASINLLLHTIATNFKKIDHCDYDQILLWHTDIATRLWLMADM